MRDYEIIDTDAANIGGCGFCGYKPGRAEGHRRKVNWLEERYADGLRFKVLRARHLGDVGMIEYAPGNQVWRPVEADGYLVIHCLIVAAKHKGKGLGTMLLNHCLQDAKQSRCRGVAVVTSSDSFMVESDLFTKAGFVLVDNDPPYELLVKKLKESDPDPCFVVDRERALRKYPEGLTILAADQCPMVPKCAKEIAEAGRALGLKTKLVRVDSAQVSRELPTPWGVFCILLDGKLIAHRPISARRFVNIMRKLGY